MLRSLVCLAILLTLQQSDSSTFYVERVDVMTKYDSRYILWYANQILPPDKLVRKRDVDCLIDELKATGLFRDIKADLIQTGPDTRKLELVTDYQTQIESFVISEIVLDRLPEADEARFRTALKNHGVTLGLPVLTYYYRGLEERINRAMREALPMKLVKEDMGTAWITIRPAGLKKLRLIVSPDYSRCSMSTRTTASCRRA